MENKINYHGDSGDFIIISSIILAHCARAPYMYKEHLAELTRILCAHWYSQNGNDSTQLAVTVARAATGRKKVLKPRPMIVDARC